jgi:prophage tail gpP-like protein
MKLRINDRIKIRTIDFFNNFSLNLKYDSVASMFSFSFYFDPLNHDQEELACVSHFHEAEVEHNGELLVTGYILSEAFNSNSKREMVQFAGYSLPGVLEDCEIPPSLYPLQSDGLSLKQIAQKLIAPFKLKMVIDPEVVDKMNMVYEKTTANESQTIKSYLTELATQRDIVVSHNEKGNLLFTKAKTNQAPIFHVEKGVIATSMNLSFSGQGLHSEITVMKQASAKGGNASEYTIQNPYVPILYRPKVLVQNSGDDNSTQDAAKNALAAELKNIVLTVTIDRWVIDGKIIKPNNLISVVAPELYIYKKTNFFIESVNYTGDATKETAVLTCVLPEVYNGKTPKNIFVDVHKNSATQ